MICFSALPLEVRSFYILTFRLKKSIIIYTTKADLSEQHKHR